MERNLVSVGSLETLSANIEGAAADGRFNTVLSEFNIGSLEE